jgi:phosphoglycerate dehydrogenase-like enzyme
MRMKVAAGREFFVRFGAQAQEIVPELSWALIEKDGSWSEPPDGCDLVMLAGDAYRTEFIDAAVQMSQPRWAHTEDAGTDGRFYDAMHAKGALVTHSPGANAPEVAEFAIGFLLWSVKRFGELCAHQCQHRWQELGLESLSDKTALVVGLGAIGSRIATLAKGFGMRVLGIRQSTQPVAGVDQLGSLADLPAFLPEADCVILAIPACAETTNLIGTNELAAMKPTATLINIARGSIVDIGALKEALRTGMIRQACLDVLPTEPWPADDDLWDMPNVFITPHTASTSPLYLVRVAELWLENLRRYVRGEELLHRVVVT